MATAKKKKRSSIWFGAVTANGATKGLGVEE